MSNFELKLDSDKTTAKCFLSACEIKGFVRRFDTDFGIAAHKQQINRLRHGNFPHQF